MTMTCFQEMSSSSPGNRHEAPSSRKIARQSIPLRKIHLSLMNARVEPAHDGARAS
jgi:hypothetical protein